MRANAYNLINEYLQKGKEGLKSKMIAQCRNDIEIESASWKLVKNAFNSPCFHYIFFEKNCQEMGLSNLKKLIREKQFSQQKEHIIPINLLELDNEIEIQKLGFEDKEDLRAYIDTYGNLISLEGHSTPKQAIRICMEKMKSTRIVRSLLIGTLMQKVLTKRP